MIKPLAAPLAVLTALAILVAGCGGGNDSTSSETTSSLTKAEFIKQGNAICAKGNEEISEAFEKFGKAHHFSKKQQPTPAELEAAAEEILIPRVRQQIEGVRALGAPSGAEGEVEAILDAAEKALEKGEEDPSTLVEEGEGPFREANKLSREFGLVKCGEEEGAGG